MEKNESSSKGSVTGTPEGTEAKYNQIKEYEHHFNNLETEIRKFASAWLLVALGAIAFLVRGGAASPLVAPKVLVPVVCLMGNIGLVVLWILDQLVYHRLLNAVFLLGLRMEYLHPTLPPIRTLMVLYSRKRGMARYIRLYYLVPMIVLALVSCITLLLWPSLETQGTLALASSPAVAFCSTLMSCLIPLWAWWRSNRRESYDEISEGFGDPEFTQYLREKKYETVLRGR
ncbi:MAG: hypothetical protein WBW16_14205 [Bacteroidota bacterium]